MATAASVAPGSLPTAGVGGALYDEAFQVPTYPAAPFNKVTWRLIDTWNNINVNYDTNRGLAAGLVWATLVYLLALTPTRKRTTLFHTFMLIGLVFMLIKLMIDIVSSLTPGLQSSSAYTFLTLDFTDSIWTNDFVATFATSQVTGWCAFVFAAICLWLQAKGLMTGIKARYPIVYKVMLTYLILTSVAAFAAAMAYSIQQILQLGQSGAEQYDGLDEAYNGRIAYLAAYTICIGSFSLVSMASVFDIVWKRPSSIVTRNSAYASALNLIGLLCVQSFVIPFIFCILQIVPVQTSMLHPEIMLLPSVYVMLPLGSLFMTVNSTAVDDAEAQKASPLPPNSMPPKPAFFADSAATLTTTTTSGASRPSSYTLDAGHGKSETDQELGAIDSMGTATAENKDHEGKEAYVSEKMVVV
ncbi:uncharacterized protein Z520_09618 [Fonsecaea multimorphosa CBS 102226]|uniref:Uncharacterized protein n=1 Tax=Fonsecaea multimorphosa CBS 102226 TaxID=1442371 RepID=A0A0D2JMN8_9EURO|nr:uncharacterized protein Z520_09618 [Fonsecaea multimorphosa CBS 102226]KIX94572.1 hypothetical protein Z520_09618 [Fonsecaea multimorphosa CBS 102226]OAL20281.1 hypothetical protein AYO22_08993 [Fonsecaea multimorphosa]